MRQKSKKYVDDGGRCLVRMVSRRQQKLGILARSVKGLEPVDYELLKQLAEGKNDPSDGVPAAARACIAGAFQSIKEALDEKATPSGLSSKTKRTVPPYAPFCPEETKRSP